jgi:hypothetical protein
LSLNKRHFGPSTRRIRHFGPSIFSPLVAALAAAAAAVWLATNPRQADNGDHVLSEGARLVFNGSPPEPVVGWRVARGVEL